MSTINGHQVIGNDEANGIVSVYIVNTHDIPDGTIVTLIRGIHTWHYTVGTTIGDGFYEQADALQGALNHLQRQAAYMRAHAEWHRKVMA